MMSQGTPPQSGRLARTLPLGSVAYETDPTERGERTVWLEDAMVDRLGAMRGRLRMLQTT
jgi:hypothetical protein